MAKLTEASLQFVQTLTYQFKSSGPLNEFFFKNCWKEINDVIIVSLVYLRLKDDVLLR